MVASSKYLQALVNLLNTGACLFVIGRNFRHLPFLNDVCLKCRQSLHALPVGPVPAQYAIPSGEFAAPRSLTSSKICVLCILPIGIVDLTIIMTTLIAPAFFVAVQRNLTGFTGSLFKEAPLFFAVAYARQLSLVVHRVRFLRLHVLHTKDVMKCARSDRFRSLARCSVSGKLLSARSRSVATPSLPLLVGSGLPQGFMPCRQPTLHQRCVVCLRDYLC